jgi:fibronectin-binding autotransporter adhesin
MLFSKNKLLMSVFHIFPMYKHRAKAMAMVLSFCSIDIFAAAYTWDVSTSPGIQAGDGTWGGSSNQYWTQNGTSLVAWPGPPGNSATFTGIDGAIGDYWITVENTQNVDSIAFLNNGFYINGGTGLNFGLKNGIYVASEKRGFISTPIIGTAGIVKSGKGHLNITGSCTFSGGTTVNAGVFFLGTSGTE